MSTETERMVRVIIGGNEKSLVVSEVTPDLLVEMAKEMGYSTFFVKVNGEKATPNTIADMIPEATEIEIVPHDLWM